jgi:hypothetical protein
MFCCVIVLKQLHFHIYYLFAGLANIKKFQKSKEPIRFRLKDLYRPYQFNHSGTLPFGVICTLFANSSARNQIGQILLRVAPQLYLSTLIPNPAITFYCLLFLYADNSDIVSIVKESRIRQIQSYHIPVKINLDTVVVVYVYTDIHTTHALSPKG